MKTRTIKGRNGIRRGKIEKAKKNKERKLLIK